MDYLIQSGSKTYAKNPILTISKEKDFLIFFSCVDDTILYNRGITTTKGFDMIKCAGYDVVGGSIRCTYNGKPYAGKVLSQRKTDKGNLLVVETADGVKSIYWEKAVDCIFRPLVPTFRNTDDGYDAAKDRRVTRYGIR
jgi:hypothetical protein